MRAGMVLILEHNDKQPPVPLVHNHIIDMTSIMVVKPLVNSTIFKLCIPIIISFQQFKPSQASYLIR